MPRLAVKPTLIVLGLLLLVVFVWWHLKGLHT